VKVMDFGIAKVMGEKGTTKVGIRIGTLWYMSPEQIRGEEATALTDIYSLGVTLYQMVTGRVPFTGDLEFDIMKGHIEKPPVPPWKINRDVPKELGEAILKALAKKPSERYRSIREFSEALRSVMKTHELSQTRAMQVPDKFNYQCKWTLFSPRLWVTRRRAIATLGVVAIAALGGIAFLAQGKEKSADSTAIMANTPAQDRSPSEVSLGADISVKPVSEQADEERLDEKKKKKKTARTNSQGHTSSMVTIYAAKAKKDASETQLQSGVDSTRFKNSPAKDEEELAPDHEKENGWRIRK